MEQRPEHRDERRRDERLHDRVVVEDSFIVVECELAGLAEDLPPALLLEVRRREQRRQQEPERREDPEKSDGDQGELERRLAEAPDEPRRKRFPSRRGRRDVDRLGGHLGLPPKAPDVEEQNCGTTSTKMKTAIAEPTPKLFAPANDVRHMESASTVASSCTEPARPRRRCRTPSGR